jgi:hypothetical protein
MYARTNAEGDHSPFNITVPVNDHDDIHNNSRNEDEITIDEAIGKLMLSTTILLFHVMVVSYTCKYTFCIMSN